MDECKNECPCPLCQAEARAADCKMAEATLSALLEAMAGAEEKRRPGEPLKIAIPEAALPAFARGVVTARDAVEGLRSILLGRHNEMLMLRAYGPPKDVMPTIHRH